MKAVHFGAGNIGRGFIGALLYDSGYETVFVDVNEALINELNERKSYTVDLAGVDESIRVANVSGLNSMKQSEDVVEAIAQADLVTTAVGPTILPIIAKLLAEGLEKRLDQSQDPVNVIACENMIGGTEVLKGHVLDNLDASKREALEGRVGFPNAAVDRIVPDQNNEDLLTVKVEPYYEWVVETPAIKGVRPEVEGITFVEDLTPYIERKLFTVNTGHATTAYLGSYYGYTTIKEAIDDPRVKEKVIGTLKETGDVLIKKYKFDENEHQTYIDKIIHRFQNPDLSDEVKRVGRAPIRKLGPKDRLVRPALEYLQLLDGEPAFLIEVIAATLHYKNEEDQEAVQLQESIKENGVSSAFKEVAGLEDNHPLVTFVQDKYISMK